ncbi:hypothetical protein [Streptomyces sp. EN23]|uniref:hypothetical protein n=1 Tax=Streptomyces sp. EN23 TaxID=212774 RepID=UPI00159F32A5|nr:hypothetical protein [Streptomyces sp. EN23]
MPAKGEAAKDGDAIFAEVTEGLKIHASRVPRADRRRVIGRNATDQRLCRQ